MGDVVPVKANSVSAGVSGTRERTEQLPAAVDAADSNIYLTGGAYGPGKIQIQRCGRRIGKISERNGGFLLV